VVEDDELAPGDRAVDGLGESRRADEVALISLLEIVLGPLWVWIARSERPGAGTIAGGVVILAAVTIQSLAAERLPPRVAVDGGVELPAE